MESIFSFQWNKIFDNWIVEPIRIWGFLKLSHMNEITGNKISDNGNNGCMVNYTSTFNTVAGNIANGNGLKVLSLGQHNELVGNGLIN